MITLKAKIDEKGNVTLLEPATLPSPRRALVVILDEPATATMPLDDDDDNLTKAELEAEDRVWEEALKRHADKFNALWAQAEQDIAAGKATEMFDENGEFILD